MGISSPPLKHPCYYGIDVSSHAELIAAYQSVEDIRAEIEVDSLSYLTVEGMHDVYRRHGSHGECDACFTGNYPVEIVDHLLPQEKEKKTKGV